MLAALYISEVCCLILSSQYIAAFCEHHQDVEHKAIRLTGGRVQANWMLF
jgi:hypothetical protein